MFAKLLLNLYFWVAFVVVTVFGLLVLPFLLLVYTLFLHRSFESGLRRSIGIYGKVLVCYVPFLEPVRVKYPSGGMPPVSILVSNHNSAIDPYLYGAVAVENGFITSWPFNIPVYGLFMRLARYVNSEEGWDVVEKKSRHLLDNGCSIAVWPEGHRSRDGRLGRFKNGAFTLAVETGYPVVPVCILGSGKVLPPGSRLFNRGKIRLIILDPCRPVEGLNHEQQVRELRNRVEEKIKEELQAHGHFNDCRTGD